MELFGLFIGASSIVASLILFLINKKVGEGQKSNIESQISTLNNMSQNLKDLTGFIGTQKSILIQNEKIIDELKQKKNILRPIVEADEKTVEAILSAQNKDNRKNRWVDYLIGFFLGIGGSIIVAIIF